MDSSDPREWIRRGPMSLFQIRVIVLAFVMAGLDGFDVLVAAYTASSIGRLWHLGPGQIGLLLSAGLVGMGLGAVTIGAYGDIRGRRPAILICLMILFFAMLGASFSGDLKQLCGWRIFTGVGIGGMLANINILVGELSSERRRHSAVVLMSIGYPVGATLGGFVAVALIDHFGWPAVFVLGAGAAAVLLPFALAVIPESIDFLLARRPKNALTRLNKILVRMEHPPLDALPGWRSIRPSEYFGISAIFRGPLQRATIVSGIFYFSVMVTCYFLLSWLPRVMTSLGFSVSTGIEASLLMNSSGVLGCLVYGLMAARFGARRLAVILLLGLGLSTAVFGYLHPDARLLLAGSVAIGFGLHSSIAALYALVPGMFPAAIRTTGTGFAMGMGRLGAIVGPFAAGILIGGGMARSTLFVVLATPAVIATLSVYWIRDHRIAANVRP